jgi:hypothetical protein
LAQVCGRLNDTDCQIAALTTAISLAPADMQSVFALGVAFAVNGEADTAFQWLGKARASKRVDMTQMEGNAALDPLRKDPRFAALVPVAADFANPFVEPVTIVKEWVGEAANDQFGWIARSIGDVDGDKVEDFVTSAPSNAAAGAGAGRVYVYSSKQGTLLWKADGAAGDQFGLGIEAAGDVNNDGAGDVIASAPQGGYARVFDGRNGKVLFTFTAPEPNVAFGGHVAGIGDVNGDKVPDLLVGAAGSPAGPADFSGRAYLYSGKDGALLLTLKGERARDRFGAALGGMSRNGRILFSVGAPGAGPNNTGRTYVYTSLSETPAFVIDADDTGAALGAMFIAVPGDLDGDGVDDVYVSDWANTANGPSTGRIYVYSTKSGLRLFALTGETAGEGFGTSKSTAGDVDGDGTPDLIVGSWQYGGAAVGAGRTYLYSGKTGALIKTFTSRIPGDAFGFDAVGIGDVDGDGTVDLLVTSAWSGVKGFHSGRVFILSSGVKRE